MLESDGKGTERKSFFFTDRAIYRPGQTVYFKGIILEIQRKREERNRILKHHNTTVILKDVNHQEVTRINLITNEYGTFSGSFQLPTGLLNGVMTISDGYGSCRFSMEEYNSIMKLDFPFYE